MWQIKYHKRLLKMKLKLTKQQKRNPFYDRFKTESQVEGFARPRKGKSSKKDRYKSKEMREWYH